MDELPKKKRQMFVSNVCVEKTFLSTKMGKTALGMDKR